MNIHMSTVSGTLLFNRLLESYNKTQHMLIYETYFVLETSFVLN